MNSHDKVTPYGAADKEKAEEVEEMFDNIAHRYDFLNHLLSLGIDKLWRKKVIKLLKPEQPKVMLDVATGTADFALEAINLNPDSVKGIDLSEGMLSHGRTKIAKRGLSNTIVLEKGDSQDMPYEDNTFDAITVGFGVRNFQNLSAGLKEMLRVLKPGGTIAILEFSKPTVFPVKQIFYLYFRFILPLIGKYLSKDRRAYDYLPESVQTFPEGQALLDIMQKNGYRSTSCKRLTFGISSIYLGKK